MPDYVDRIALRNALYDADAVTMRGVEIINQFPGADVRPVVRGYWLKLSRGDVCSECNYSTGRNGYGGNFCPNCGADMREGE